MSLFHESLQRVLSGATLSGLLSPAGNHQPTQAAVLVKQLQKAAGPHDWLFQIAITAGGKEQECSVKGDVHWHGSTPVLTMHDVEIPGVGQVSGKLMIHNRLFAATWVHEGVRGHAWGDVAVRSAQQPPSKQFVIERSSEFLREWWTGSDWSKDCTRALWFEHEPDGPRVTDDEEAHAVFYPSGEVEAG